MNIQLHGVDIEITDAIETYANKKAQVLLKVLANASDTAQVRMELGRSIGSHKTGNVFKTEVNVDAFGTVFRTESSGETVYRTIDDAVDEMLGVIKRTKGKKEALWRRGASMLKRLMQGR